MLTDKQIGQFIELYERRFGTKISKGDAVKKGIKLVNLLKTIHKPINTNQ